MTLRNKIGLYLGPLLFIIFILIPSGEDSPPITLMAAVALLMAVWWITEAIPIPATALLPVALFPVLGLMSGKEVCPHYINSYIFLFMGGFIIALALERWNLHRRIALYVIRIVGDQPRRLVLGFMLAVAFLSMWISNTAASMMMLPIGMSVIALANDQIASFDGNVFNEKSLGRFQKNFSTVLMLGIAYGASIGGIGTLVGTPPNLVFSHIFRMEFPSGPEITFTSWLLLGIPFVFTFLIITWVLLVFVIYPPGRGRFFGGGAVIKVELEKLGAMTSAEKRLLVVFLATALLWIFRQDISFSAAFKIPGWSSLLSLSKVDDGTVAMFMALTLFLIPAGNRSGERLMDWNTAKNLPWGILLLFGGGFALAAGFKQSGLSLWIGSQLAFLANVPTTVMIASVSLLVTFLTEMTSNTATTQVILPVLASLSRTIEMNPLLIMLPATLSASCAFMLPVATPPNAVVFGSGYVPIIKMVRAGIILNFVGALVVLIVVYLIGVPAFHIDVASFPSSWSP